MILRLTLFTIGGKGSFICTADTVGHIQISVYPDMEHWGEGKVVSSTRTQTRASTPSPASYLLLHHGPAWLTIFLPPHNVNENPVTDLLNDLLWGHINYAHLAGHVHVVVLGDIET